MISCTEFIPAYSELFKFIDQESGRQAVYDYWDYIFQPEKAPLNNYLAKSGLRGCWDYWSMIYTEEACDSTMFYNEKEGWWATCMHSCPSKGRFDKLGYMTPFDEYCKHCNGYDWSLHKYGLVHEMDYRGEAKACCRDIIVDPNVFTGNTKTMIEEMYKCEMLGCSFDADPSLCPLNHPGTLTLRTSPKTLKYLHRDFHTGVDTAVSFALSTYGMEGLRKYLAQFVAAFHMPLIADIKSKGLAPLAAYLRNVYELEEAADAITLNETAAEIRVDIAYCPAVRYFNSIGKKPSSAYEYATSVTYDELAKQSGIGFEMLAYDEESGKASYRFYKKQV